MFSLSTPRNLGSIVDFDQVNVYGDITHFAKMCNSTPNKYLIGLDYGL